jgi:uncharacterized protein (DUF1800 family)
LLGTTAPAPHKAIQQLRHAAVLRAVLSQRQLQELVVDMWTDHFAIQHAGLDGTQEYVVHDREVIRRHALGRFEDLLRAVSHSPPMLRALDNHTSVAASPNENFARELLELHTLGAGSFSEADVKAAARVFTGWTIDEQHLFRFDPATHDTAPAEVAGWRTNGTGGARDGDALLTHLAAQPATARTVALRLCRRLVADDPPSAVVDAAARSYLQSGTSIAAVIRTIVGHDAFWASYGAKSRRGLEVTAAVLRACRTQISSDATGPGARAIQTYLVRLGQRPFEPPSPEGLPDVASAWATESFVLARWNMALRLLIDDIPGIDADVDGIFAPVADRNASDGLRAILDQVVPGAASGSHVPVLLEHFAISPAAALPADRPKRAELLALCMSVPEVQVR